MEGGFIIINGIINYLNDFYVTWLFGTNYVATQSIIHFNGNFINLDITQYVLVNIFSIITIIMVLLVVIWSIRWLIKGVFSLI